ncbi:MAG: aminopeptidase P family protein [Clostridia bacterium]|nr:aminopeptidase P family protein [Clostridia bacterium]
MRDNNVDYMLLAPTPNMFYLTGLETSPDERLQLLIVPGEGPLEVVIPEMYAETAEEKGDKFNLHTWADHENPVEIVGDIVRAEEGGAIAVDQKMWAGHFLSIKPLFQGCSFVDANLIMSPARVIKDSRELELLKEAGELADQVMELAAQEIRVGLMERELVLFIENKLKTLGAEGLSFSPIVASGPNASSPHHIPGDRQFEKGDFIVLDFGGKVGGYCSDITRTFCIGEASNKAKQVHRIVQEANEKGYFASTAGTPCEDVDRAAREVIDQAGYGEYFIHRTGHGIGLDCHEDPYIVEGNITLLEQGMTFSIEPGIYLPGEMGVRIEDIAAVTEEGPVRFNNFPRGLIEL